MKRDFKVTSAEAILDEANLHNTYYATEDIHRKNPLHDPSDCGFCKLEDRVLAAVTEYGAQFVRIIEGYDSQEYQDEKTILSLRSEVRAITAELEAARASILPTPPVRKALRVYPSGADGSSDSFSELKNFLEYGWKIVKVIKERTQTTRMNIFILEK